MTGAKINFSEAVRSLVEIALKSQGIELRDKNDNP